MLEFPSVCTHTGAQPARCQPPAFPFLNSAPEVLSARLYGHATPLLEPRDDSSFLHLAMVSDALL